MEEVNITEDAGKIRQDRYSLRTAPQWIGPLIEDVLSTVRTVEIECNSSACS
jgi:phenylalanine ammonia-lyase